VLSSTELSSGRARCKSILYGVLAALSAWTSRAKASHSRPIKGI
jgi:hypothetical protein